MARRRVAEEPLTDQTLVDELVEHLREHPDDVEAARDLDSLDCMALYRLALRDVGIRDQMLRTMHQIAYPPDPDAPSAPTDLTLRIGDNR